MRPVFEQNINSQLLLRSMDFQAFYTADSNLYEKMFYKVYYDELLPFVNIRSLPQMALFLIKK